MVMRAGAKPERRLVVDVFVAGVWWPTLPYAVSSPADAGSGYSPAYRLFANASQYASPNSTNS